MISCSMHNMLFLHLFFSNSTWTCNRSMQINPRTHSTSENPLLHVTKRTGAPGRSVKAIKHKSTKALELWAKKTAQDGNAPVGKWVDLYDIMRSQPGASARGTKPYDNDDRTKKPRARGRGEGKEWGTGEQHADGLVCVTSRPAAMSRSRHSPSLHFSSGSIG
jgi:hypothetical protein